MLASSSCSDDQCVNCLYSSFCFYCELPQAWATGWLLWPRRTRLWLVAVNCKARSKWCSICRSRKNKCNIGYESGSGYLHGSDFKSWSGSQFWSGYETQSGFRYVSESGSIYLFFYTYKIKTGFYSVQRIVSDILMPFLWVLWLDLMVVRPGQVYFSF
jgi:hypothetical protein